MTVILSRSFYYPNTILLERNNPMIRLTNNTKTINGRTVTQIVQNGPIATNLEDIVQPNRLGGWVESLESITHKAWITENVILFKEAFINDGCVIDAVYPNTVIENTCFPKDTIITIEHPYDYYPDGEQAELTDESEMTAHQYKQKYFAFDSYGDPIDPNYAEKIHDPIYEKLKKRDKYKRVTKIIPNFVTEKFTSKPSKISSDNRNFIMRFAGEPGTKRYKWVKRFETLVLVIGIATLLNMLIRMFIIR